MTFRQAVKAALVRAAVAAFAAGVIALAVMITWVGFARPGALPYLF